MAASSKVFGRGCRVLMAAAKRSAAVTAAHTATATAAATNVAPRGLMKPLRVSPALGAFLGVSEASRSDVVKKVWQHIKLNNLQALKNFLDTAEAEVRSLISLYSEVEEAQIHCLSILGRIQLGAHLNKLHKILAVFAKMLNEARDENEQQADAEKKKLEKEAMNELTAAQSANDRSKPDFQIQKHAS